MNAQWADWLGVGLAVAGAAGWLLRRALQNRRRRRAAPAGPAGGCGPGCTGCPFAKDCSGKTG